MSTWFDVLLFSFVGSFVSLAGGLYLLFGRSNTPRWLHLSVPFAAGALLAASFLDLLPEALHSTNDEPHSIMVWALTGFLAFFVIERGLRWFHHHHEHEGGQDQANRSLIVIGDTMHNFIDGLAIGAAFLVNPVTGIVTTLAVAAHEIPQELGDFGLLMSKGMRRRQVIMVNIISALATVIGAALVFGFGAALSLPTGILLALTAGFFIYIAASDIVPTIHQKGHTRMANIETIILIFGVVVVAVATQLLHGLIES